MSSTTQFFFLFIIFLAGQSYAQTPPKKTTGQKIGEVVSETTRISNLVVPVLGPLFDGDMKGVMGALGSLGQGSRHPQFPQCIIMPNIPNIPGMCSYAPTNDPVTASEQTNTNARIGAGLNILKRNYEMGTAETDNLGANNNGIACLNQQVSNIDRDFEKISKVLDDSVTNWKLTTDALMKEVDVQKEQLTQDYNLLFTGGNDKFNPVTDLLAQPGCESMFEEDGISKSYLNNTGDNKQKHGGLMGIQQSQEARVKSSTEFIKNAGLIQKDLNNTLNELEKNINNTSINKLVTDTGLADSLKTSTTDLSQYSILENSSFTNGLRTALTDMRTEREGLINSFQEYLNPNDPSDSNFIKSLKEGGDANNKDAIITSWKNDKERKCIYQEVGATDQASFEKKLYTLAAPKDRRMNQFDCGTQKSCSNYIKTVLNTLSNDQDGQTLSSKITKVSANSNVSVQNVYTFKTPQNPAARNTLGQLIRGIESKCQKTMALNKASYAHVVKNIIAPAVKKIEQQDKNLRKKIMSRMRNEIMDCKGKPINYGSCENNIPTAGSKSSFCFKQANICSTNIKSCSQRLNQMIDTTKGQIKINADNINAKVKLLKENMHADLITKMTEISKTADTQLNIPGLSKYAGYESTKNEFTFGTKDSANNPDAFFKDFPELQNPPMNIKISNPADAAKQYAENIDLIREKYKAMKTKIMQKMNEEITKIRANYANAIKLLNDAIQQCTGILKEMQKEIAGTQDKCVKEGADELATNTLDTIIGSFDTPETLCKETNSKDLAITKELEETYVKWRKNSKLKGKYDSLVILCNNRITIKEKVEEIKKGLPPTEQNAANKDLEDHDEKIVAEYKKFQDALKGSIKKEAVTACTAVNNEMGAKLPGPTPKRDSNKDNKKVDEN